MRGRMYKVGRVPGSVWDWEQHWTARSSDLVLQPDRYHTRITGPALNKHFENHWTARSTL